MNSRIISLLNILLAQLILISTCKAEGSNLPSAKTAKSILLPKVISPNTSTNITIILNINQSSNDSYFTIELGAYENKSPSLKLTMGSMLELYSPIQDSANVHQKLHIVMRPFQESNQSLNEYPNTKEQSLGLKKELLREKVFRKTYPQEIKLQNEEVYAGYRANNEPIHPRYYSTLLPERISYKSVFDLLGSSKLDVWRASARQAYADSPSLSTLWRAFDPQDIIDPELRDIAEYFKSYNNKLTKEEFEQKYGESGLKYDHNFTVQLVEDILERKKQREINEYIIAAGKGGLVEVIVKFGLEVIFGNLFLLTLLLASSLLWWVSKMGGNGFKK
ncbi:hypothetical protein [Candidatus Tisiphia endosymbiont of Ptychoptera albimana]|uniref:hypothetical protein n=1 Tax=Candidatus Tisiphia endosymbiont of Ptychoptera albimana TaxID=3066260 RepID=UPI00312CBC02